MSILADLSPEQKQFFRARTITEVQENIEIFDIYLNELKNKYPDLNQSELLPIAAQLSTSYQNTKILDDLRHAILER